MVTERRITVDDLQPNKAIYVRSAVGGSVSVPGDLLLNIGKQYGGSGMAFIPKTWIPICLTDQAPAKAFIESTDFRRAVASGAVKIISEEEALKVLNTPDGTKENDRIRRETFQGLNIVERATPTPMEAVQELSEGSVSLRVKDILMRTDINDDEKLNLLRAEAPFMGKDDFNYVLTVKDEKSVIGKWASRVLEQGEDAAI